PVYVDKVAKVPEAATVDYPPHGCSTPARDQAVDRRLKTIDTTCPLVTKLHHEAKRFVKEGQHILLIGHDGHEEVEGTAGEVPGNITLVEHPDDVDDLEFEPGTPLRSEEHTSELQARFDLVCRRLLGKKEQG